jgi:Protein of unknown function (DUF1579)
MEMPKPTEAHRKLAGLAGHWIGKEKLSPSPWDPKGGAATGRCDNGFVLVHDYEQERNGTASFHGHGVFSYDNAEKCYLLHWWDSMGFGINVFRGQFEGHTLRLLCKLPQGSTRGTWTFVDGSHYRFLMEVSPDGQKWMTMIEGDYTQKG